jgi:beta-glucosidase
VAETYGEDPYLTSRMGVAFVKGLQGNDPKYFEGCSYAETLCCSQWSGTGTSQLRTQRRASENLQQTYLPAFHATNR